MQLTMLAPGARTNSATDTPVQREVGGMQFQLNVDGQQVTSMLAGSGQGGPRFSRDAIAEFELITNRFDATQGRSGGVQVNAVTKSGTNTFSGTVSGYFRDDRFNAKDFIVNRVLPYSDQQVSTTFGGPIKKDRVHIFGVYEGEREPQAITFTSLSYPRFNLPDMTGVRTEQTYGIRLDTQFTSSTHLMVRGNRSSQRIPFGRPLCTPGATMHPSAVCSSGTSSTQAFASLTQVLGARMVNEIMGGYSDFGWVYDSIVSQPTPNITLLGYSIGKRFILPQDIRQKSYSVRDNFTYFLDAGGHHALKLGGEFLYNQNNVFWANARDGLINATGGPPPANLEDLFPVWDDPSTWNLAALSPITVSYTQAFGTFTLKDPRKVGAAWFQDNWTLTKQLTLNLGIRYDVSIGQLAEGVDVPPFRAKDQLKSDWNNVQPRLGFVYALADQTAIRGGWGKHGNVRRSAGLACLNRFLRVLRVLLLCPGRGSYRHARDLTDAALRQPEIAVRRCHHVPHDAAAARDWPGLHLLRFGIEPHEHVLLATSLAVPDCAIRRNRDAVRSRDGPAR
jgi:TonB-dependent receptor-like protein